MNKPTAEPHEFVRIFRFVLAVFGIVFLLVFGYKAAASANDITAVGGKAVKTFISWFSEEPVRPLQDKAMELKDDKPAVEATKLPSSTDTANPPSVGQDTATTPVRGGSNAANAPGAAVSVEASNGASMNGHDGVNNGNGSQPNTSVTNQVRAVLKDALLMP